MRKESTFFFEHGHVANQIDRDDEKNRMQVKFHARVKLMTLGLGQTLNFNYKVNFKDLYTKLCVCSHK